MAKRLIQVLLWSALILALIGSLRHVAWAFASLEDSDIVSGYVQGIAIDVGLFALAFAIQQRKKQERSTWVLWLGVSMFCLVSVYANLLHGLVYASDLGLVGYEFLIALRPYLLSAALPVLVLYLSEVVSEDVRHEATEKEGKTKQTRNALERDERLDKILFILMEKPDVKVATLATELEISKSTVYSDLRRLEEVGKINRSNGGVVILEK